MTIKQKKAYVIMPNHKGGFCRIVDNVCVGHYSKRSTAVSGDYRDAQPCTKHTACLLYTSDAADDLLCVDLGGRRIIKKKTKQ